MNNVLTRPVVYWEVQAASRPEVDKKDRAPRTGKSYKNKQSGMSFEEVLWKILEENQSA